MSALASAGVEFDAEHIAPIPRYFSGTNARAYHWATLTGTTLGFTRSELWVGGVKVAEADYEAPDAGNRYVVDAGHAVMFDSSDFEWLDPVLVELRVWTTDGGPYSDTWSAPSKNSCALFGRYDLEGSPLYWDEEEEEYIFGDSSWAGIPTVWWRLTLMGYPIPYTDIYGPNEATNRYWDYDMLSGPIGDGEKVCSIFYVNSHGGGGNFWSDSDDYNLYYPNPPDGNDTQFIYGYYGAPGVYELGPVRENGMGTGLPPFNSTKNPPMNLAFIDSCDTSDTNDFAEALLIPYGNYFAPYSSECQSQVGYVVEIAIQSTKDNNLVFWGALLDGYTVHEAREQTYSEYDYPLGQSGYENFMKVWGDFYTRLNGVYTGTSDGTPCEDFARSIGI